MATKHGEHIAKRPAAHEAGLQAGNRSIDERMEPVPINHDAHNRQRRNGAGSREEQMAVGLGWFSITLGLAEVMAPSRLARLIGVPTEHRALIRTMGIREIVTGIGILSQRAPATGLWARVGGDVIDLGCLGAAFLSPRAKRTRIATAAAAVAGVTALDILCAQEFSRGAETRDALPVKVGVAINRSPQELYRFWHDVENLPRFMAHLESVTATGARRSHWVARGPAGTRIEWDAEIVEDRPNDLIAWRSLEGAEVHHSGSVRFEPAPGGRGTLVTVDMQYSPPGGTLGAGIAALFGEEPSQTVKRDLRRFKQVMETGEIITTQGQPAGRSSSTSWKYDQAMR